MVELGHQGWHFRRLGGGDQAVDHAGHFIRGVLDGQGQGFQVLQRNQPAQRRIQFGQDVSHIRLGRGGSGSGGARTGDNFAAV